MNMELQQYLDKNKMTAAKFARIANIAVASVHNVRNGDRLCMSIVTAISINIASKGRVRIIDLFGEDRYDKLKNKIKKNIKKAR